MTVRKLTMTPLTVLCALAACLFALGAAAPARAAITHEFLKQITEVPGKGPKGEIVPVPGKLGAVEALSADSGRLYVADSIAPGPFPDRERVDVFDVASASFLSQFPQRPSLQDLGSEGMTVGHSTGEPRVYLGARSKGAGVLAVFDQAGGLVGEWSAFAGRGPIAVAADDSAVPSWAQGDVFVANETELGSFVVLAFKPEEGGKSGKLEATLEAEPGVPFRDFVEHTAIAVDQATGDLLVATNRLQEVEVFKPSPLEKGKFELPTPLVLPLGASFKEVVGLAADASNGNMYVADSGAGGAKAVYEFDSTGKFLGELTGTPSGSFASVRSTTVESKAHHEYVGDFNWERRLGVVDEFGAGLIVPDVAVTEPVSGLAPTGVTLNGTVNPDGAGEATCEFEYGTSAAYGHRARCTEPVANASVPVPVKSVSIMGLEPDTTYHYRLDATNVADKGTNKGKCPEDCGEFATPGPGLHGQYATGVSSSAATLNAQIDPNETSTTYYFQYGLSTSYERGAVPAAPGAPLAVGKGDVHVEQHVQGLQAGAVYHYRAVAVSEWAPGQFVTVEGADHTFATQAAGALFELPDGRGWEMVSPVDKHGAVLERPTEEGGVFQASAAGDAFTYLASGATEAEASGAGKQVQVLSRRGGVASSAPGWASRDIAPPHSEATGPKPGEGNEYRFFSEDLSVAVVQPFGASFDPLLSAEASEQTAYLRRDFPPGDVVNPCSESCYRPLVTGREGYANVPPGTEFGEAGRCGICGPTFVGATPDGRHIVLEAKNRARNPHGGLTATPGDEGGLYEWSGGALALVSVLPEAEGKPGKPAPVASGPQLGFRNEEARGAISSDGSRVVWSEFTGGEHLYLRDLAKGQTVQLDAVKSGAGEGPVGPNFQAATWSGAARVFFTDTQRLTANAGAKNFEPDLYECQIVEGVGGLQCALEDLTPEVGEERAGVQGDVLGVSEDGSYLYFVADGALAEGAVRASGDCEGPGRTCNLYVRHDGVTRLVAVVSNNDAPDWGNFSAGNGVAGGRLRELTARVSPAGRWLSFMSRERLTGYDNVDAVTGVPVEEVYVYDASSGRLACASCDPTGARPRGVEYKRGNMLESLVGSNTAWAQQSEESTLAAIIPGWTNYDLNSAVYQPRYLSDEGRVFFDSFDRLVPNDVNGTWDVYEWEPVGVGGCTTATSSGSVVYVAQLAGIGGCVGLVSSGTSSGESAFLDASESGNDVFFLTSEKLSPSDVDTSLDVYDAHVCSAGSPCLSSAVPVPACQTADACRAAPAPQPGVFGAPASASFAGPGNVPVPMVGARTAAQIRAEKLSRALRACRKIRGHRRRAACERRARRAYGAALRAKRSSKPARQTGRS
jgi:hypothetical protein